MQEPVIGVCGDVHGHLQLALCSWAIEQRDREWSLDAILLCGGVGTFTTRTQLDRATIRHGAKNPCELEFLSWAMTPPPPWLSGIFAARNEGGLGLQAPVIMVSGNHEGFDNLEALLLEAGKPPPGPVAPEALPTVDALGRIRLLPSGWRVRTSAGRVIGGVGGIQPGQRPGAGYPPLAYIDPDAVSALCRVSDLDVLITHQGPSRMQGPAAGAEILDPLLGRARRLLWFHGHSRIRREPQTFGDTTVIPLADATFDPNSGWRVANDAWQRIITTETGLRFRAGCPAARQLPRHSWMSGPDGSLVAPQLAAFIP